jgi:hypothetical protein
MAVQQALLPLVGLPLAGLGRAANMAWLAFGQVREVNVHGHPIIAGQWALHISCVWRLCQRGNIVVAYRDFYYDASGEPLGDNAWDGIGASHFDQQAVKLNAEFEANPPTVVAVGVDDVGGFSLSFDDDYRLDAFPDQAIRIEVSEHWRLFQPGASLPHFVAR